MKQRLSVPFIEERVNYCGPAVLAMVMRYQGHTITQNEIGRRIQAQPFGATIGELAEVAEAEGFDAKITENTGISDLVSAIDRGVPVIIHLDTPFHPEHFNVVIGYDLDYEDIIVHDPEADIYGHHRGGTHDYNIRFFEKGWYSRRKNAAPFRKVALFVEKK